MKRKIRMGMVGGGPGAFIGAVHRIAARLDGEIELVSGVFGRDPAKSRACAEELYLDPPRINIIFRWPKPFSRPVSMCSAKNRWP